VSALRRLRPQGWHSQTPSDGQVHIALLIVSGPRIMGADEEPSSSYAEGFEMISEESGAREQPVQIRRCRWRRRTDAGGLIVQFYLFELVTSMPSYSTQNTPCKQPFHTSYILPPCLWHNRPPFPCRGHPCQPLQSTSLQP
jgi:hypothetical protein